MSGPGTVVLVATPIGNLGDLAPRAIDELTRAHVVCCEDTRRTGRLLQYAGVRANALCVVNDHTELAMIPKLLARLDAGERIALVTDAGTPGISDPGERLVAAAASAGHCILIVPGPSAVIAALVSSGLPTSRFVFEGFLPRKGAARLIRLRELAIERRTVVCYESPHRVAQTLIDLAATFGASRRVAVARELTKLHEEVFRGTLVQAAAWAEIEPRGEIVLVIDGAPEPQPPTQDTLVDALKMHLAGGLSVRDASAEVAVTFGASRREIYALALTLPRG